MNPRHLAPTLALVAFLSSCRADTFLTVRLTSDRQDISRGPVDVNVVLGGSGRRAAFAYNGNFASGTSDFVVRLGPGGGDRLDIGALVSVPSQTWAGDARVALPSDDDVVTVPVSPGDLQIATSRYVNVATHTAVSLGTGMLLAWPDVDGVSVRVERDLDRIGQRSQLLAAEPNASAVRTCSRGDLAAVVWRAENGTLSLRTFGNGLETETVALGSGADVHAACMPAGGAFDVAVLTLDRGKVSGSFHTKAGNDTSGMSPPTRVAFALESDKFTSRVVVGVAPGPEGTLLIAARGNFKDERIETTVLARVRADGATVASVRLPGDTRAIANTGSGARVMAASVGTGEDGALDLKAYDAMSLRAVGEAYTLATARDLPQGSFGVVDLASCAIVWPETRRDGTDQVDLRYVHLDMEGKPSAPSRRVNTALEGDAFFPSAACTTPEVAWVSFVSRASAATFSAQLRVRKL